MAKEVVNPFDELTFQEIYDGIESQGYIERTHKNIISQLKNTVRVFCFLTDYVIGTYLKVFYLLFNQPKTACEKNIGCYS